MTLSINYCHSIAQTYTVQDLRAQITFFKALFDLFSFVNLISHLCNSGTLAKAQ